MELAVRKVIHRLEGRVEFPSQGQSILRVDINPTETHGPLVRDILAGCSVRCFLGLSPDTSFLNRGRLRAVLQWLKPRVSQLTIAEGSFLTRWNLRAIEAYSEHEAEQIAVGRHDSTARRIAETVSEEFATRPAAILDWPSVVHDSGFRHIRSQIESYAARTPTFERGVVSVVDEFLSRMQKRGEAFAPTDTQMALLKSYVFEELAMFVHLYQAGFPVEVYPGDDLEIMRQFSAGGFKDFPFELSARTHVSLRLSR